MEGHGGEGPPASDAILFALVCFACGIFIKLCLKWTRIPYTAMLLLWGLAIGFLQLANPMTEAFTNTLQIWLSMDPHLLLLIFLPIIGFSAAVSQEPHVLRKSWVQIMVLAWPGVVIQFLLIALCGKYFFPYNWTWPQSFLFGAMLSATDPVAVVAVLQEVGASSKLACVIDGESLMNDGSALVIFLLLQKIVEGEPVTIGGAVSQFCLLAVVGMLLGIAFGAATSWLLDNIFRDPTLTTVVTLVSAYASYYTADSLVGASGLLAVVCNGFAMSLMGGRQIVMRVEDAMHGFWGVLEWGANTILFVWVGITLAIVLPPSHKATVFTDHGIHLEAKDAAYVVVLYLWLQVARSVLILVCWLPFNYTGYPLTWRSAFVIVWGGLRGAVGMVMGLFIFLDTKIEDESFKSYCIFYMGTMAFFTVLINGGTCKKVLQLLGFMSYTPEQLSTLQHVVEDMDAMRSRRLADLRPDDVLGEPEPDAVKVWSMLPTEDILADAAANTMPMAVNERSPAVAKAIAEGLDPKLLYDYRCRLLHMAKQHYAEVYEQHLLSTPQMRTLQSVSDTALDEAGVGLLDWKLLEPYCQMRGVPLLMQKLGINRVAPAWVQASAYQQAMSNLHLLVGFIRAHKHAQRVLDDHIRNDTFDIPETFVNTKELQHQGSGSISIHRAASPAGDRGGAEAQFVLRESEAAVAEALALVEALTRSHPSLPAWLRSKQAALEILTEQHHFLDQLAEAGLVQPREVLLLDELMQARFEALLRSNTGVAAALQYSRSRPPVNVLPLFDSLKDDEAEELMRGDAGGLCHPKPSEERLRWKVYYPGQIIAALGSSLDHVVVISKGSVKMRFPVGKGPHGRSDEHTVVASVGDPLCVCELMLGLPRMSELTADSMVQALLVPARRFTELTASHRGVWTRAWQATAAQLAAEHHDILGVHKQLAPLNMFFRACEVVELKEGAALNVPRTGLLLTGSVEATDFSARAPPRASENGGANGANGAAASPPRGVVMHHTYVLAAPAELPPGTYTALKDAMVLQVPRGPELPSHLETTTYQAQVLSKGSIPAGSLLSSPTARAGSGSGHGEDQLQRTASGGGKGGATPVKGLLGRISRNLSTQSVPLMPFLHRALASMHAERTASDTRVALHPVTESGHSATAHLGGAAAGGDLEAGPGAAPQRRSFQSGPAAVARRAIDSVHAASLRRNSGPGAMARRSGSARQHSGLA